MEHSYIEENQVIDRYLMGQLPSDEAERFEEHYVHCQDCLDQLEVAEKLQRGIKRAVTDDAAKLAAAQRLGVLAWLARLARSPQAGVLAMALLVVAVLPTSLLVRDLRRTESALEAANATLAELERRQAAGSGAPDLEAEIASVHAELAAQKQRFEDELGREQSAREDLAGRLSQLLEPQANTGLFSFSPERSAPAAGQEPSHVVRLSAEPEWIVLSFELDLVEHESYRVTLLRAERQVWQEDGLEPNYLDSLVLSLHSSWLEAGDYVVRVESAGSGDAVPVAQFSFRVIAGG